MKPIHSRKLGDAQQYYLLNNSFQTKPPPHHDLLPLPLSNLCCLIQLEMLEQGELGTAMKVLSKESADTVRGWFSGGQASESYEPLLEDEEADLSADLSELSYEEEKPIEYTRRSWFRWRRFHARRIFWTLLPSFVAHAYGYGDENSVVPDSHPTSYLNGLRGIAAMVVIILHYTDDVSIH